MPIVEVKVVPVGTQSPSYSSYVAACYSTLAQENGLKHTLTPTSTIIEGDLDRVMSVVQKMHKQPFGEGAHRVMTTITIDERNDKNSNMDQMVQEVVRESRQH